MTIKVLIVEDDTTLQSLYIQLFSIENFKVVGVADNGKEGFDLYQDGIDPDIVIMDYRMPVMNGLDAAKLILDYDPDANIIFASADDSIKDEALRLGARKFIDKPFNIDEIQSVILSLV